MTMQWAPEQVRKYWAEQAVAHGASHAASWTDVRVMEREIQEILQRLPETGSVLDVGCANGWSTLQFAADRPLSLRGVDYIPEMIDAARERLEELRRHLRGTVEFDVGDALGLAEEDASYDAVVCIRVIINLGDWEAQVRGLRECLRVLKPGGVFLLSEATLQGWRRLNALRAEWGLSEIPMPSFNNYLDQERVEETLADQAQLNELVNFSSTYFVGTRLLKPLLQATTNAPIDVGDPNSEWNRWMASLPAWGDYGTQKLFVFQRQ